MRKTVLVIITALLTWHLSPAKTHIELEGTHVVIQTADGARQSYKPEFIVIYSESNPNKKLRRGDFGYNMKPWQTQGLLYNVPTWGKPDNYTPDPSLHVEDGYNPETDRSYGDGRTANYFLAGKTILIHASSAEKKGDTIVWLFPENDRFTLKATVSHGTVGDGIPEVKMEFTPKKSGWYSVGYIGAPSNSPEAVEEIWQAHIWSELRFPNQPFLSEAFRLPIPTTLVTKDGITTGVIASPSFIPFESAPPTSAGSRFGVMLRNAAGEAQPMVFAPVLGNRDSMMKPGQDFRFSFFLYQKKAPLMEAFKDISYNVCSFRDLRRNSTCNLNTTIENTLEYCLSPYAMFIDSLRGCNYSTDVPGAVKNISGLHPLEFAILTDNESIFKRMARPMLEYGLSRERFLFSPNDKVKGQGTSSRLNGPGVPVTDLLTSYIYSGGNTDYFLSESKRLYDAKVERSLNLDFMSYEDRWLNSLVLYHATGEKKYLDQAITDADKYLAERVYKRQRDFEDKYSLGLFFWTSFTNQWMELLLMYELTGEQRYLDAAHDGALHYAQYCWFTPVIPDGTVRVNPGGVVPKYRNDDSKYKYMHLPEKDIEAWKVSEIGLTPESSGTSAGHRAIFMAHHAPFMMRIAALTGDRFLHDIARHAVVGRYEGFPGYHINAGRTDAFERKDFAFRSQAELNGHTSIHYNHPQSHLAMLWDYLFSDFYYVSGRAIDFPVEYSEGYAYCRSFIYGAHPGKFYSDEGVHAYMPAGMIESSSIQTNYLSGYGNGRLYVALSNQSSEKVRTTLTFDPSTSFVSKDKVYSAVLWKDNKPKGKVKVRNGQVTLDVSGDGITAIAIEGVDVKPSFQSRVGLPEGKWAHNYTSTGFEKDRAVVFDFGPGLISVYVWNEANNEKYEVTTLHYAIDGVWQEVTKSGYPYEYTIPLSDSNSTFEYWFEAVTPEGKTVRSKNGFLCKEFPPSGGNPLENTFVNPLPLPDYPLGNWTRKPSPNMDRWLKGYVQDFRELADPSVIYDNGRWIMYPSVSMAYVSEDFKTWKKVPVSPEQIGDGYAPSVCKHGDKYYLVGCFSSLYVADDPLGPFEKLGPICKPDGESLENKLFDPMLFSYGGDLYLYWHQKALWGVKLDRTNPTKMASDPVKLAVSHPENIWERYGEYNEDPRRSFMEGVWMYEHGGKFYLTFASPGTANGTYAIGAYVGDSPLGDFVYQKHNPVIRKASGTVPGSGHGCIVDGPGGTIWAFTTSMVNNYHVFERRISLFPVGIDESGELFGLPCRDVPQWAPGFNPHPEKGNEAGWLPVSVRTIASASSCAPGRTADYAIDDYCRSWWQPERGDSKPSLIVDFKNSYYIAAFRIMWAEPNLDHNNNILPGPIKYKVYYQEKKNDSWHVLVDNSMSDTDYLIDYKTFDAVRARRVKLEILESAPGLETGVLEMTVFGKP